jgi:hypothetical protein
VLVTTSLNEKDQDCQYPHKLAINQSTLQQGTSVVFTHLHLPQNIRHLVLEQCTAAVVKHLPKGLDSFAPALVAESKQR